ncbi:hypothetical protein GXP65_24255 [Vibrio campbellii]|uniref:hypothetical protein n=1 Tax=Vibrio sp. LB10LO1 TaxID=2711207 RepID=UPI001389F963|nr:hypothetical protein [Vibrio sp. LB10LO1]NDJ84148.1 hypothetical protein [Vibrio sp. LB10LO1]
MANRIEYNGVWFDSYRELFDRHACKGLTYAAFHSRVKSGWTLEKALNEEKNKSIHRVYIVGDKKFKTLKELADSAGISYDAAVKRVHRGFSDEEVFYGKKKLTKTKKEKQHKTRGSSVQVLGVTYENLRAAHEKIKPVCSYNTLVARLRYNWSIEEALEVVPKTDGRTLKTRTLNIKGEVISVHDASVKYGVSVSTILDRLNRGASDQVAITKGRLKSGLLIPQSQAYKARKKIRKRAYIVDGVEYSSVASLARAYSVPAPLVYNRMRDNGWSAERSVKEPISDRVEVDGIIYRSSMSAWEAIGETNFSTYQGRKANGHELRVCLGLDPLPTESRYVIHGKTFSSLAEVASYYHLNSAQLNSRLNNMSLEEAVVYQPSNGRYSRSIFKKNPELAKAPGVLYFVKISLQDGVLHKVGITQKKTRQRFQNFEFSPIIELNGSLEDLFEIEQSVKKEFKSLHYRAEEEFEGKTETFLLTDSEERLVVEYIKSLSS